ncbi:hypothetical protein Q4506_17245 [Colwellia sp. 4_MG-2023]|uniref:hypothetical protein n=1 Tax=unclassified Colwellia TaxID=196834 RepID=UPI0026E26DAF|nr:MULTISPECIES: hypothetical protein [unclassified Colwellia]MDO6508758.1 hypothetical protein [Colwellia sp. 5_MG-2023]MDO6557423.1 hypothetical protein [Colwellia sp. 4_MG-2023]
MKNIFYVLVLICCISNVKAAQFSNCTGCNSSISYSNAAESEALKKGSSRSSVYSFNMASNQIKAYDVYVEYEPGGYGIATAIENSVDANTQQSFNALAASYSAVAEHVSSNQIIPSNVAGSAYQLINASYVKNNVTDYYNNNQ